MNTFYAAISRQILPLLLFSGIFSGCRIFDPAEEIPCYLHIDSISLSTTPQQGSNSARITEAWIYVDNMLIGGFELPCTVPILTSAGSHHVLIRAGIQMNGNPGMRAMYPFYKGWESDINLVQGSSITIEPAVTYFPGIDFSATWMCNFEGVGVNLSAEPQYLSLVVKDTLPADVFEGVACGYVHLNTDTIQFIGKSTWTDTLNATKENYLEMNYRCDAPFTVGIVDDSYHYYPWMTVGESSDWNKIYIRLTDVIATAPSNVSYRVYIGMYLPSGATDAHLYLDNIKLVK